MHSWYGKAMRKQCESRKPNLRERSRQYGRAVVRWCPSEILYTPLSPAPTAWKKWGLLFGLRREFPATIFGFPDLFFRKQIRKIDNIVFVWTPGTKITFWILLNFFNFLYMASISDINHHFRAPNPLKPLIKSGRSKSTGGPTYSSFGPLGTCFSPVLWPKLPFFDLIWPYLTLS